MMCLPMRREFLSQKKEPEKKHRDMEQSSVFSEMQVHGLCLGHGCCLVRGGGEDGDMMLNDR